MVLQTALTVSIRRCVGIELSRTRCATALTVLSRVKKQLQTARCEFRCEDFMKADLSDATVIYTCSTAFSTRFMRMMTEKVGDLRKGVLFVTPQELDPHPRFRPTDMLRLDMSWKRRTKIHIYEIA